MDAWDLHCPWSRRRSVENLSSANCRGVSSFQSKFIKNAAHVFLDGFFSHPKQNGNVAVAFVLSDSKQHFGLTRRQAYRLQRLGYPESFRGSTLYPPCKASCSPPPDSHYPRVRRDDVVGRLQPYLRGAPPPPGLIPGFPPGPQSCAAPISSSCKRRRVFHVEQVVRNTERKK